MCWRLWRGQLAELPAWGDLLQPKGSQLSSLVSREVARKVDSQVQRYPVIDPRLARGKQLLSSAASDFPVQTERNACSQDPAELLSLQIVLDEPAASQQRG